MEVQVVRVVRVVRLLVTPSRTTGSCGRCRLCASCFATGKMSFAGFKKQINKANQVRVCIFRIFDDQYSNDNL